MNNPVRIGDGRARLYLGDSREVLKRLPGNSVDSACCDPPYELGFMGKSWDNTGIAYDPMLWGQVLRVLKPGGHLLAFGGTRTFHRLACAIEDAGFELRDAPLRGHTPVREDCPWLGGWMYGSGFPKSLDVSKAIDKAADYRLQSEFRRAAVLVVLDAGMPLPGRSVTDWTEEDHAPGDRWWSEFCAWIPTLSEDQRERIHREVVGVGRSGRSALMGGLLGLFDRGEYDITASATDAASQWEGWGTALKPAWEPIVMARKPLIGTVAANVLAHGTGALNIDGCRVDWQGEDGSAARKAMGYSDSAKKALGQVVAAASDTGFSGDVVGTDSSKGRWPANLITDGSPEVVALFPREAGAFAPVRGSEPSDVTDGIYGERARVPGAFHNDTGSAARFFYCAKASQEDRNEGCSGLPERTGGMVSNTSGQYITRRDGGAPGPRANHHPTVKPTDLMAYLCRLVTPKGGTVLDPFMGSGSTGKAAMLEGFNFIGIDLTAEYVEIARARIEFALRMGHQPSLLEAQCTPF